MPDTTDHNPTDHDTVDKLTRWLRRDYDAALGELVEHYPSEQRSLELDWTDLHVHDPDLADDYLDRPGLIGEYLETALGRVELPVDINLGGAHVRVHNIPVEYTYYPGGFSPSKHLGAYRSIRGEVTKATDVYPKIEEAAFECQRCGILTHVPQSDGDFQEPHECQGCERQGPFQINFDQSEFIDAQKLRIKEPPELADGGGQKIDAFVEDDLAGTVTIGDRVVVSGEICFEQDQAGNQKKPKFDPYLKGDAIEIEETDQQDLDVTPAERSRIEALADGAEGEPLEVAADSLAPKVYGYDMVKKALLLAMVSGGRIVYPTGDADRADVHVLVLGDPGTAKSKLIDRAQQLGWRTVGVSSKRATVPGLTAAAEQDDFGDGEWVMKAGAFVKANGGTVCIDELDDMPADTRAGMLEPMSKQRFSATLAGENVTFRTEASVIAAGNPKYGRFDPFESVPEQFDFDSALISRFDLVYTVRDKPDEDEDRNVADHILTSRDAAKRDNRGEDLDADAEAAIQPPVSEDLLPKWIALARQRDNPPFASADVKNMLRDNWLELRGMYDYEEGEPIPVTFRSLEGIVRVAEAVAKFEFADAIEHRHARIASEIVGRSMDDIGKNQDGELDADIQEVGESTSQRQRRKTLAKAIQDLQSDYDNGVPRDEAVEAAQEEWGLSASESRLHADIEKFLGKGEATEPQTDHIRYIGRW